MNRRKVLKGIAAVPVAGVLAGCRREPARPVRGVLRVILNGPFGVVLESDKDYHITAYVPSDPEREHELRFLGPLDANVAGREPKTGKPPSYRFALGEEGLDIGKGQPQIDQGFYDFYLPHIGNFELPPDPFAVVELPRPDYITFTPPAQSVFFGRATLQPLDHILEYRMTDPDRVRVKPGDKEPQPSIPCSELLKQFEEYWYKTEYRSPNGEELRRNMEEMLRNCSSADRCLLFGVGFDPQHPETNPLEHGISFFNNVLLPSFAPNIRKTLHKAVCTPSDGNASQAGLMPASLRYPIATPRILQIASVLDCQSGGVMGHRP